MNGLDLRDSVPEGSPGLTRLALLQRGLTVVGALSLGALRAAPAGASPWPPPSAYPADVPAAWFDLALDLVRTTSGFSPPVASRAVAYAGVALHEAFADDNAGGSFAGRLNGLTELRRPSDDVYHWPTVANAALASILRALFPTASAANVAAIDRLESSYAGEGRAMLPPGVFRRSAQRGRDAAGHVFAWSTTDGGHEAFRNNFPPYSPPNGPGFWVRTPPAFLPALQPYWGSNRTFALPSGTSCAPPPPLPYSEIPGSDFYEDAYGCYVVTTHLDAEQEAIARFWSDDPGTTATPPGHSISILTQILRGQDARLGSAADAYARVGVAVADAFIACWQTKYTYNLLRPVTYIPLVIDPTWSPLLVTPPFPEYTSGHSVQSAAAARVMTDLFGAVSFTDHTHDARGLPARSFSSVQAAAQEAAISRVYGGIHFQAAIERGLAQGDCVGARASAV
jgi:PAP2 superfamily protein